MEVRKKPEKTWPPTRASIVKCNGQSNSKYENITLRNITIYDPQFEYGQGVILAADDTPMENIIFHDVKVVDAKGDDFAKYRSCEGVASGIATGNTYPVPPCFEDKTDANVIIDLL